MDVPASMERLRRIRVKPDTGSLAIYGLPFALPHSFVAYTRDADGCRYCLQEAGMAADKEQRPYVTLLGDEGGGYGATLEWMNESIMTDQRLLLLRDGQANHEHDTTQVGKMLASKVQRLGLIDLAAGRHERELFQGDVGTLISETPDNGTIFIVGRRLVIWANHHRELAQAIVNRGVSCTFVIADPTLKGLKSLVLDDYAVTDLPTCWKTFKDLLAPEVARDATNGSGTFEVYGIPTYVPVTFASYTARDRSQFCSLEVGIGVGPAERPSVYFRSGYPGDMFGNLNRIFRRLIDGRQPLLRAPNRKAAEIS
jgi:hypothetical protein